MKNYMRGFIISLILFIVLDLIDGQVYNNVLPFSMLILLLSLHVIVYKNLIPDKKRLRYFTFVLIFLVCVYFSLPELTYNQAKEKILNEHDVTIVESYIVPVQKYNKWNPFEAKWAYFFEGLNSDSE